MRSFAGPTVQRPDRRCCTSGTAHTRDPPACGGRLRRSARTCRRPAPPDTRGWYRLSETPDRSHDGVVDLRVVLVEPLAEIFATAHAQAGDLPRPVESGPAVVAALRIGQIELGRDRAVGNLRLRKFRGGQEHGGRGERETTGFAWLRSNYHNGGHRRMRRVRHFVGSGAPSSSVTKTSAMMLTRASHQWPPLQCHLRARPFHARARWTAPAH